MAVTGTRLYGKTTAQAWDRLHPRLTRREAWLDHGLLPIIEGTAIRRSWRKLPSGGMNKPVWLWWSGTDATAGDVDRCWQSFLRRLDLEHTFRLFKQTLEWTKPRLRSSEAADRWIWLVVAVYAKLRRARPSATDLRRPSEKPAPPNKLTPSHVRRRSETCARRPALRLVHRNRPSPATRHEVRPTTKPAPNPAGQADKQHPGQRTEQHAI